MSPLAQNWWALALRGVLAMLFALVTFTWPGLSVRILLALFGAYALAEGSCILLAALRHSRGHRRWWSLLLAGGVSFTVGVWAFYWPDVTASGWLDLVAAWALAKGVLEIAAAIRLRRAIEGEWSLALSGIASLLFGSLAFVFSSAGAVVWPLAAYALAFGLLLLSLACKLRRFFKHKDALHRTRIVVAVR